MVINIKDRILPILAYRYWTKNKSRSSEENWKLAEKLFGYMEKRKSLIQRIMK